MIPILQDLARSLGSTFPPNWVLFLQLSLMQDCFYEPTQGDPSLRLDPCPVQMPLCRSNYFSLYFFTQGTIHFEQETHDFVAEAPAICCINTYQPHAYQGTPNTEGWRIQFHANFLCIETYHEEVGCNGVLFNFPAPPTPIQIPPPQLLLIQQHINAISEELLHQFSGKYDALLAHLKLLLILGTRLKLEQGDCELPSNSENKIKTPSYLTQLTSLIEENFRSHRKTFHYANKLGITAHHLNRLIKLHWRTKLSSLLLDRLIKEAKWQLLHSEKSVKVLASELDFKDEFYFSRWFKKHTGLSPSHFRNFEWQIRGIQKSP